tara:strand:+ start:338 stop:1246 length:909 start_codon:yes stop_codon:yes gene_type:complete
MCEIVNLLDSTALEADYVSECARIFSSRTNGDLKLVIKHHWQQLPDPENKWIVLINLSDESHGVPVEVLREDVAVIFQPYYVLDKWDLPLDSPKIRPFPLGPTRDFNPSPKPIKDRKYDAFFSGNISKTGSRNTFKTHVDDFLDQSDYNMFINYTDGFNKGISKHEYAQMLSDSKIALCPTGAISKETFRFYEALKSGCIIICEVLPKLWFYEQLMFCHTKWHSIKEAIDFVMSLGDEEMQKISDTNLRLYKTILSPEPIAKYMLNELNKSMEYINKGHAVEVNPEIVRMAKFKAKQLGVQV